MDRNILKGWIAAARPRTLPAALGPIIPGSVLAWSEGKFRGDAVFAASIAALLLQISVNVANDYFDFINGIDTSDRLGPKRAAASGLLSLKSIRTGMIVLTLLILVPGLYLVYIGGIPVLIIGIASVLSVYLYSAGPFPLSSNALGDLFVFLFFGPVAVCGTYYVQTLSISPEIIAYSVSIGMLVTAILVVNNYRDIDTDRAADKKTLAVVLGRKMMVAEYCFLLFAAYLIPVALVVLSDISYSILLFIVTIPLGISLIRDMGGRAQGKELNKTLAGTAGLSFLFSIFLSLGIFLG